MAFVAGLGLASCTAAPEEETPAAASNITSVDEGIAVGPDGGGVRDRDGVLSVVIPPRSLDETTRVVIRLESNDGARGTPRYRVTLTPPVSLRSPAQVTLDLDRWKHEPVDPAGLRLASGTEPDAPPTSPLVIPRGQSRSPARIAGTTLDLDRVFGLMEATTIDCDGASCNTCCLEATRFSCNATCSFDAGQIAVDCLRDSDCGEGLKCCMPSTQRGGGVLRVDDDRITCKADCGGENLHVCDVNDPDGCQTCSPAKAGCSRGYCGSGPKTPTQLICP